MSKDPNKTQNLSHEVYQDKTTTTTGVGPTYKLDLKVGHGKIGLHERMSKPLDIYLHKPSPKHFPLEEEGNY